MIRRRRRKDSELILYGSILGGILLLLVAVVVLLLVRSDRGSEAALAALAEAAEERQTPTAVDPWAGMEKEAILRTKRTASAREDGPSVDQLIFGDELKKRVGLYRDLELNNGTWSTRRVAGRSLYWVSYEDTFYGVNIGPRWLVQLDPKGPRPEGSNGVIPANALAELLMTDSPVAYARYLNRTDAVLDVLLKHRFDSGLPLASAILIYFGGRNKRLDGTELLGWAVVPLKAEVGGEVLYDAFFQWRERGRLHIAHFQVDLSSNRFEARNLLANAIVAEAGSMNAEQLVDIRPRALNLNSPPSRERDPMIRALRYIVSNQQLVESVGALLSFRAQSGTFSYDGWRIEPDGCSECSVSYRYRESDKQHHVSWDVSSRGKLTPTTPIAEMATRAISIASPVSPEQQAKRDSAPAAEANTAQ